MSEKPELLNHAATKDEITVALRTWVTGSRPQDRAEALAFLEAVPQPVLVQVLPSLWRSEYTGPSLEALPPLQQGIVSFCLLHPFWQFVPLLIETLTVREDSPENLRPLLTDLLPTRCREAYSPLTYEQRAILVGELEHFLFRNVGFLRRTFASANPFSDAEANFCLAVLQTLRHDALRNGILKLDKKTLTALKRLPYSVTLDDPNRHSVLETAQLLLQEAGK